MAGIRSVMSLMVAERILAEVRKLQLPDDACCWVESYSNGREQGYHIKAGIHNTVGISFAGHRNSDCPVVYIGPSLEFSMQGNLPSDEIYRGAFHFEEGEEKSVAGFICEKIADALRVPSKPVELVEQM